MTQLTVGFQLGGQAYSQIIFFEDQGARSTSSRAATSSSARRRHAVAITAGASAQRGTTGACCEREPRHSAATRPPAGKYHKGMAVFTVAKGGLMYEASIGGQKFTYTPKRAASQ